MAAVSIIHSALAIVPMMCYFMITNSEGRGFSVNIFHRNSHVSPFYNPHETRYQRFEKTFNRPVNRFNRLNGINLSDAHSELTADINGGYLMNISIGTPPFQILLTFDTGSEVTWMECTPFPNKGNLFTTASSSTYKTIPCPSKDCDDLGPEGAFCSPVNDNVCHYKITYPDKTHSLGDFAFETLTLRSSSDPGGPVLFENTFIGCSYDTDLNLEGSGIAGLGRGPASLINQLGPSIDWKYSYCLPISDGDKPLSTIDFGGNVTGDGVVSSALIYDPLLPIYFFLRLEAVSVGDVRIQFGGSISDDQNIAIDSATTVSVLPSGFFFQFSSEVQRQIVDREKAKNPPSFFTLCYELEPAGPINAPQVTMHFVDADVELSPSNLFVKVDDTLTCFAFRPSDTVSIYGNVAQQNFLIGYDIGNKMLSFKPAECGHN